MSTRGKRLGRLKQAIAEAPVRRPLLLDAYEWFTSFGELPEDDHVAYEVVARALRGGDEEPVADEAEVAADLRRARLAYYQRERPGASWPPSVRALLFDEALFETEPVRKIARAVIAAEVAWGGDVENPAFGARHGIPSYGSVAMHVMGWPRMLAVPPYESQAKRLLVRLDNIKGQTPQGDPRWFEAQGNAISTFRRTGELPDDELHIEVVLANVELDLLCAHRDGRNVSDAMALLDAVQWAEGAALRNALAKVCAMAKAGQLP